MAKVDKTLVNKLLTRVKITSECWIWEGAVHKATGVGQLATGIKGMVNTTAHRLSYLIHIGSIPDGHFVTQKCGNKLCVSPAHLTLISRGEHSNKPPSRKGKGWSEESKQSWSEKQKGKPGKQHSSETKEKLSAQRKGENGSNWKGGVTPGQKIARRGIRFANWRKAVYERDGYQCQKCKSIGGRLHPHHIENFSSHLDKRYDVNNGITLCASCHIAFHKAYGKSNNNSEQLSEYLTNHENAHN